MSSPHELSREPFPFSESFWNPLIVGAMRPGRTIRGGVSGAPVGAPTVIRVSNTMSAVNCPKYGVMKLDAPVTLPSVSADAFQENGLTMKGIAPVAGDPFVIAQEAIPYSPVSFGNAVLRGMTLCKINVIAEGDQYADCVDNDVDKLKSGGSGPAEILWKESGTGTKWAIVNLDGSPPPMLFAKVTAMKDDAGVAWVSWAATKKYPAYVEANPCRSDGTGVDTGTTVYVAINSKRDLPTKLITAVGEIVGYIPGDGLLVINTIKMHGQAVEGQGCWHAGSHAVPAVVGAASEGLEAAETTTWDVTNQPSGKDGVEVYVLSRVAYYDAGNQTLYGYSRKLTFDSEGRIVLVGGETRVAVDVPDGPCT